MSELSGNPEQVGNPDTFEQFGNPEQLLYTPTTEEVREGYSAEYDGCDCENCQYDRIAFDRWLAEVKAQAWQEGWDTKPPYQKINNPYRQGEEQ